MHESNYPAYSCCSSTFHPPPSTFHRAYHMKLLLIGGGGREHALAWKLNLDQARPRLFCAPGNAGTAGLGENLDLAAENVPGLLAWARREKPDLTVVGPEAPLCAGLVDEFQAAGLRVFGPSRAAAQLEGSKGFTKEVLRAAGVPTASGVSFTDYDKALAHVRASALPVVIKADGLAAGKGVTIATTQQQADQALRDCLVNRVFGGAGASVLIEDFLEGEELSVLALVDGEHVALLPSAQDHKRAFDADQGPNTGGMGAYSPAPLAAPSVLDEARERVFNPVLGELRRRGIVYKGVLYAGLMIARNSINVLEFNCRFGDPETQAILPRINSDLIPAMEACIDGVLRPGDLRIRPEACVCVAMTAEGYPGAYRKGDEIRGLEEAALMPDVMVFHAGTKRTGKQVVTSGGRVLGVTALGADLPQAARRAYEAVAKISFKGAHWRKDIAARGLRRMETDR